jgi:hypothetical protein
LWFTDTSSCPKHFHLLITEPEVGDPSVVMKVIKQRFTRQRFYDFVAWSRAKRLEKLRYIHRNPVKRGLVLEPGQWLWSSFRHYAYGEASPVLVDESQPAELKFRHVESSGGARETILPTRKKQEWGSLPRHSHPCIKRKGGAASD